MLRHLLVLLVGAIALMAVVAWEHNSTAEARATALRGSLAKAATSVAAQATATSSRPRVFVGIKTAAGVGKYRKRRDVWRKSPCAKSYRDAGIDYKFIIGAPIDPGHDLTGHCQGCVDTIHERAVEKALLQEHDQFGDIYFIPIRDSYMNLPNKLLNIFQYGYSQVRAQYIGTHDDEYCLDPEVLMKALEDHERANAGRTERHELYAGDYFWKGDEYGSMKGPTGIVAPYFSGHSSIYSRGLLRNIVGPKAWAHSLLGGAYGSVADDCDVGKWIKWAQEKYGLRVDFKTIVHVLREAKELVS